VRSRFYLFSELLWVEIGNISGKFGCYWPTVSADKSGIWERYTAPLVGDKSDAVQCGGAGNHESTRIRIIVQNTDMQ
jgi:hypothetical protein